MTNKQYEHLGRALVCEAKLDERREALDGLCNELSLHLGALVGNEAANGWIEKRYGKQFSAWHGCREFMDAVRDIIKNEEKKEVKVK